VANQKALTDVLFHEGTISTLYGLPESGKTNLMVFLSQCAAKYYNVYTVIQFFDWNEIPQAKAEGLLPKGVKYVPVPDNITTVKTVSDLLLGVLSGKNNATILDEAGIFASTRAPMSKKLRYILNLSFIIRHLRSSFVYVTQTRKSIPPEMRESLVSYEMSIYKESPTYRMLLIKKRSELTDRFGKEYISFRPVSKIGRIPLTTLPWDGHYIPKFEFDLDLDKAWNELGEYGSLKVHKYAKDIITGLRDEFKGIDKDNDDDQPTEVTQRRMEALEYIDTLIKDGYNIKGDIAIMVANRYNKSISWANMLLRGINTNG